MGLCSHSLGRWEVVGTIPSGPYACRKLGFTYGVSGTLTPDATCQYDLAGSINGKDYFARRTGTYYLWWDSAQTEWIINVSPGTPTTDYWKGNPGDPPGNYSPQGTYTGSATVCLGEHP